MKRALAILGVWLLGAGLFVALVGRELAILAAIARDGFVFAIAGLAIVLGLVILGRTAMCEPVGALPEPSDTSWKNVDRVGAEIDDVRTSATTGDRQCHSTSVRLRVQGTVHALLADRSEDEDEVRTRIQTGTWTSNRTAAAFLSPDVDPSLSTRILGWLYGDSARRGLEATVEELERLAQSESTQRDGDADTGRFSRDRAAFDDPVGTPSAAASGETARATDGGEPAGTRRAGDP